MNVSLWPSNVFKLHTKVCISIYYPLTNTNIHSLFFFFFHIDIHRNSTCDFTLIHLHVQVHVICFIPQFNIVSDERMPIQLLSIHFVSFGKLHFDFQIVSEQNENKTTCQTKIYKYSNSLPLINISSKKKDENRKKKEIWSTFTFFFFLSLLYRLYSNRRTLSYFRMIFYYSHTKIYFTWIVTWISVLTEIFRLFVSMQHIQFYWCFFPLLFFFFDFILWWLAK